LLVRFLPLILKNALRNRRRSALTIFSIAASFCLLGVLGAMYHAFFFTEGTPDQALRLITRNRVSLANTLPLSYRDRMRKVPGVRAVSVYQYFGGVYKDSRDLKNYFARFAVEPDVFFVIHSEYQIPLEQRRAFQRDQTACIIGRPLALRHNLKVGDRIAIAGDIYPVNLDLTVRGIYDSPRDNENLYFQFKYLEEALHGRRENFIGMFMSLADRPESVVRIADEIDTMFSNSPQETLTESERAFELGFLAYVGDVKALLLSVCGALTFTVLLVAANTMAMSVRERVREVGILKTLGYTPGGVLSILLGESVLIAETGGMLGLLLALLVVAWLRTFPVLFVNLKTLTIPAWLAGGALLLAAAVGLISSWVPAWGASRRPIVECLRFTD
jgi:putative ABC transport system permease protein